ncbi:MAG TPA: pyridoxal-phosphate dependent enzyme [Candidatus Dormibacteraeota bacterium]|nr:pyridoxal-phosphate dependent enzyme [Candidatus Dormibacteraeota bacterium]
MSVAPEPTIADLRSAADRLRGVAHVTQVVTSRTIDALADAEVILKCENLQRVGAFKFRGAYNAVSRLTPEQLRRGVATYSSGNHAQAVALACRLLGTTALVVMPEDTPAGKRAATEGYGAEVVTYDRYRDDRVALGNRIAAERGLTIVPPYESADVIAGQGTVALELLEDGGPLDAMVVPVGGGGLLAGCSIAAKALLPAIRMIGVEPEDADDTRRSLAAGHRVRIPVSTTIADGQAADIPGELTFSINRRLADDVVLVSDDEIRAAMVLVFERLKLVVEPSGASALAAVLSGRITPAPARIGVVISGGNISAPRFAELVGR